MNLNVLNYKIKKRYFNIFGERIYSNYIEALANCSTEGYENEVITQLIKNKAIKFRADFNNKTPIHFKNNNILALLSTLNGLVQNNEIVNVIDFGGGDGSIYFLLKRCISKKIKLNWYVVETSAIVKAFKDLETENLFFRDDLTQLLKTLSHVDILHTACAFQYTPEPVQFLTNISNSNAQYKIYNRQSLNAGERYLWTIQRSLLSWHGSKDTKIDFKNCEIKYPHLNMPVSEFEKIVQNKNEILYTFEDNTGIKKVNKENIIGKSYVVALRK